MFQNQAIFCALATGLKASRVEKLILKIWVHQLQRRHTLPRLLPCHCLRKWTHIATIFNKKPIYKAQFRTIKSSLFRSQILVVPYLHVVYGNLMALIFGKCGYSLKHDLDCREWKIHSRKDCYCRPTTVIIAVGTSPRSHLEDETMGQWHIKQ